jgi:hypothetical protein
MVRIHGYHQSRKSYQANAKTLTMAECIELRKTNDLLPDYLQKLKGSTFIQIEMKYSKTFLTFDIKKDAKIRTINSL